MAGWRRLRFKHRKPRPYRVSFEQAVRKPTLMRSYVKEWCARRRKEGAQAFAAGALSGGLVWMFFREPNMTVEMPKAMVIAFVAIPVVFTTMGALCIVWPQAMFWLDHPRDRYEKALAGKGRRKGKQR